MKNINNNNYELQQKIKIIMKMKLHKIMDKILIFKVFKWLKRLDKK